MYLKQYFFYICRPCSKIDADLIFFYACVPNNVHSVAIMLSFYFNFVSSQDEVMGGWMVSRIIDENEPISYKFTPKFVLKGGQSVTVIDTLYFP